MYQNPSNVSTQITSTRKLGKNFPGLSKLGCVEIKCRYSHGVGIMNLGEMLKLFVVELKKNVVEIAHINI